MSSIQQASQVKAESKTLRRLPGSGASLAVPGVDLFPLATLPAKKSIPGALLAVPKVNESPLATLPRKKRVPGAASGAVAQGKNDGEEDEQENVDDSDVGGRPRASEDSQRFMNSLKELEDGFDAGLAPPKCPKKGDRHTPKPKQAQVTDKNVEGMDFFDQLDALEGGYFLPM